MPISKQAALQICNLHDEATRLSRGTASERAESQVILSRIKSIREDGISSDELRQLYAGGLNDELHPRRSPAQERRYSELLFAHLTQGAAVPPCQELKELRDIQAGQQTVNWTLGAQGAFTVPLDYRDRVDEAMAQVSPFMSAKVCDFVQEPTATLQPQTVTGFDLSVVSASLVSESAQQVPQVSPGGAAGFPNIQTGILQGNRIFKCSFVGSYEAEQDIPGFWKKISRAAGVAFGRGIGKYLTVGTGGSQPAGIMNGLVSSYSTGATKLVHQDFLSIFYGTNAIYRRAPQAAWLFNDSVYQRARASTDSAGRPLIDLTADFEGNIVEGICGQPLFVTPDVPGSLMQSSPATSSSIVFGDLSHFKVRTSQMTLSRETQASIADITKGEALFVARMRADSFLFDPSSSTLGAVGSAPPIVLATVLP